MAAAIGNPARRRLREHSRRAIVRYMRSIAVGATIALALIAGVYSIRCDGGDEPPRVEAPAVPSDAASSHVADEATTGSFERNEVKVPLSSLALAAACA
jgi:predicted aspartyl protease